MKKVDSSVFMDRHASTTALARDDRKKVDSMDRHDFASAKSRNDRKVDSSYQRCVGKGGSKGLVWSFMDSRAWLCSSCLDLSSCRASKIGVRSWELFTILLSISSSFFSDFSSCIGICKTKTRKPKTLNKTFKITKPPKPKKIPKITPFKQLLKSKSAVIKTPCSWILEIISLNANFKFYKGGSNA